MSSKLKFIPDFDNYDWIRNQMKEDLSYRLANRTNKTSFGRPLYERINCQIIMTHECPYHCPFCLERKHPMKGSNNFDEQIKSLEKIIKEHPNLRLTITGGEPSLYIDHVKKLVDIYNKNSNGVFCSINTTGYNPEIYDVDATINLSVNDYVKPDTTLCERACYQTVIEDDKMNIANIKKIMDESNLKLFSFRSLCDIAEKHDYNVQIFNEIKADPEFQVGTFRVGDFFTYLTFNYKENHGRITIGDMYQQMSNNYQDGYSNIIIHPDGRIGTNWR